MSSFETDTAVTPQGDGVFSADVNERWWVVRGPHGGYIAAILLRALMERVGDDDRPPRSLTIHYVAAPKAGAAEIATTIEREGTSSTFASARMTQNGKLMANAIAVFSRPWTGLEFFDATMPETVPPEEGFPVNGLEGTPPFLNNFDMRWTLGEPPMSGADEALVGGWMRLDEPLVADYPSIACLMDAGPPAIFPRVTEPFVAPTLDLTIHFRTTVPLPNAGPEDYYLGKFWSLMGRDGFFEEDGQLWSRDGTLIAQSRQLALALKR
ncbi:MAG: acyl-CoA thioesterase [Actinomycetota bacterium]